MMFSEYKQLNELEDVYDTEKKQVDQALQKLNELRHQIRRENEESYDLFLHLKEKMNYSNEANGRMLNNIEEYEYEVNRKKRWKKTVLQMSLHQNITSDIMTMKTK